MAMTTNTTKSIRKTSTVLAEKCEHTKSHMNRLLAGAGVRDPEKAARERVHIPLVPGDNDDVLFVGMNGVGFYFRRGETAEMPAPLAEILRNTGIV